MDTEKDINEIEVALAETPEFNYIKNIVAFNINGWGEKLLIDHECDMLVLTKAGYLYEIEIKRSFEDFMNEFKKKHRHESELIKRLFYCIPKSIIDKVSLKLKELNPTAELISFDEDLKMEKVKLSYYPERRKHRRLFLEEKLELARLAAIQVVKLRKEAITLKQKTHPKENVSKWELNRNK